MGNKENPGFSVLRFPSEACVGANSPETLPQSIPDGVYLAAEMFSRDSEDLLLAWEAALGPLLLVPEVWRDILLNAGILISSSLSGGTLQQRLEDAAKASPGRCWLRAEQLRMRFPLPCPSGTGIAMPREELDRLLEAKPSFFSPELCCRYCYDLPDSMILYDTDETLSEKIRLAQSAGFVGALMPSSGI